MAPVNKGQTQFRPPNFLTRLEDIFLTRKDKKLKIPLTQVLFDLTWRERFDIFRGNFPNPNWNHKWLTRPEPQKIDPTVFDVYGCEASPANTGRQESAVPDCLVLWHANGFPISAASPHLRDDIMHEIYFEVIKSDPYHRQMADPTRPEPRKLTRPDLGLKFLTRSHH